MARVFVTDGFWSKTLAVVRSLGKKGIQVTCGERTPLACALFSRFCHHRVVYPSPTLQREAFRNFLLKELRDGGYSCIFPMEEQTMLILAAERETFEAHTRLPFVTIDKIEKARDKFKILRLAAEIGIPVPRTEIPESLEALPKIEGMFSFPVVIKPRISSGSRGLKIVERKEDFKDSYMRVHRDFPFPMVQEFIPRGGAFGVSVLFGRNGEMLATFAHRRLREYPVTGGPSTLCESIEAPEMVDFSIRMLSALEWFGVAMVEFRLDRRDKKPKLMEVNPRFWGSLPLAVHAGVDFPYLLFRLACGEKVEPVKEYRVGVRGRWLFFGDILHFLSNPDRFHLNPGFFSFFDPDTRDYIFSLEDPAPVLGTFLSVPAFLWRKDLRALLRR